MKRIYFMFAYMPIICFSFNWRWGIHFLECHVNILGINIVFHIGSQGKPKLKIRWIFVNQFKVQVQVNFRRDLFRPHFQLYITDRKTYVGFNGK